MHATFSHATFCGFSEYMEKLVQENLGLKDTPGRKVAGGKGREEGLETSIRVDLESICVWKC